jgi:hypothetical protein
MHRSSWSCLAVFLVLLSLAQPACARRAEAPALSPAIPEQALTLRNRGLAALENEVPAEAEEHFRALSALVPGDPLPWANLAVALLRQQKGPEALQAIDRALALAPDRPDLLSIRAEVLIWEGRPEEALPLLTRAVRQASRDPETNFALYRLAESLEAGPLGAEARTWSDQTLDQLARLRPENVVVLSSLGRRAIGRADRTAATGAYLRLRELAWQGPPAIEQTLEPVIAALEGPDPAAARVPAQRLENVLKITPMYQQGQRELTTGIQGIPVLRFATEPPPATAADWGTPAEVRFRRSARSTGPSPAGSPLALADFDGDGRTDVARLVAGDSPAVELLLSKLPERPVLLPVPAGLSSLAAADLDNDGHLDLLAAGAEAAVFLRGGAEGTFTEATTGHGLAAARGTALSLLDFDIEGDLDLAIAGPHLELFRNNLAGPLEAVGGRVFPALTAPSPTTLAASDLDRDGDQDLLLAHGAGLTWLDNLRQGQFRDRSRHIELDPPGAVAAVVAADLDNDGRPELVVAPARGGVVLLTHEAGGFRPHPLRLAGSPGARWTSLAAADFDHDGRLDLAAAGPGGVAVWAQRQDGPWAALPLEGAPPRATAVAAADLDGDGDPDLAVAGPDGLHVLVNEGGNRNPWLTVELRGLDKGNSKNNLFGVGSTVEVLAGAAYQFREAGSAPVHFGLGAVAKPDTLRVTWTNGVPQHRVEPQTRQRVVEEQVLKGSCPFLFAWDGRAMSFVTDLLWGAPAGLPLAPGVWAPADAEELVHVPAAEPDSGRYRLAITEELWEAAFFDYLRLWVVDHPAEVTVASSLRIVPGQVVPERVLGTRDLIPVATAWDGRGGDVTARVAARDEVYASGYAPSPYQGVAAEPWAFTFDLGTAPGEPVRLHLTGWIFPADASLNLAVAQRPDLPYLPPRLEVETAGGWQVLMPDLGHPAGKTKTLVVDTPPLPARAHRLRIVTNLWLHWDQIAWSRHPADHEPRLVARLEPTATLSFRGFSRPLRQAPNGPHRFDYQQVTTVSPWLPFPGRYTRYGDVSELLRDPDSRSVILAPGDQMLVSFDASALPPPLPGYRRAVFLESHGWDKDADRNTFEARQVEPLPFRGMSGYPYGPEESFPDTPLHRRYREEWLTREVGRE